MKANYFLLTTITLLAFITCGAQTIVGKWQRDFTKWYQLDKTTGKQVPVSGKNLDLNIPLVKGEKTTITIETLTGVGYKRIGG